MRTIRWVVYLAALLGSAVSSQAQKETWLDYRTSTGGEGYEWLELSTNPPPNVALPSKLNATPYFAKWTTPLDPKGRWICFDRTRKSGPYNRIYVDSNGNGRLDDKTPIDTTRVDTSESYFDLVRFSLKGEDGPIAYHLNLRMIKYSDTDTRVLAYAGGSYQGKVDVAGKKRTVRLIDANVNGIFNDRLPNSDGDRIEIDGGQGYLGKLVVIDNQYYKIEVARDGAFIKLQKADDLVLGNVQVPEAISSIWIWGEMGHFAPKLTNGTFTVPVGKYKVYSWTIERKDAKGVAWQMSGSGSSEGSSFEVASAKPAVLAIGEPIQASLRASESSDRTIQFQLQFRGANGESLSFRRGNETAPGPRLIVSTADGKVCYTNKFEFG